MNAPILIALGGNAISPEKGTGTPSVQFAATRATMAHVADLIARGVGRILITHGNGPQVGEAVLRGELAQKDVPPQPLDICVADTQGGMGYMIQQCLRGELDRRHLSHPVVALVTQVRVDREDPAFNDPSKPIGRFYGEAEARRLMAERGWRMKPDAGRGWRRVVPSPRPLEVLEEEPIRRLLGDGAVVIAAGGGGIPVFQAADGSYVGVEAVIDKDLASALLARRIGASRFAILTGVDRVELRYGTPAARPLDRVSVADLRRHLLDGHFAPGSMRPKIEAVLDFLADPGAPDRRAAIGRPHHLAALLEGHAGTQIAAGPG